MDPTVTSMFNVPLGPEATQAPVINLAPRTPARYEEQDGKHKGIAGVGRDILGTLGDFLLTRLHMPAMYAPAQQKRRLASAQEGYQEDPQAAIERVTSIDPVFGAKLRDQNIDNTRQAVALAEVNENRAARLQNAQQQIDLQKVAVHQRVSGYAASMLGTMATWDQKKREQYYPKMREQVLSAAKRQGFDLSADLPETYDPVALDAFVDGNVPLGTQRSQRLTEDRNQVSETQGAQRLALTERGQNISHEDRVASREAAAARSTARGGVRTPKSMGSYVGDDGKKHVMLSDGTERSSAGSVRASGNGGRRAPPATASIQKLKDKYGLK